MKAQNRYAFFLRWALTLWALASWLAPGPLYPQAVEEDTLRILVPNTTSALPLLLLAERDPIPGLDIRVGVYLNHPQALALVLRGEADLLLTGTSQGWENYLAGGPLVMIDTGVWGLSYLVGLDQSIRKLGDLKGKRLAFPFPGAPLEVQTRYLLKRQGLDPDRDLRISYSPFPQAVARLLRGDLDAAPLPEPLASEVTRNQGLKRLLDYKQAWAEVSGGDPRSPQVSLFATRLTAKLRKQTLAQLDAQWGFASREVGERPQQAAERFALVLGLKAEVLSEAAGNTLYEVPGFAENQRRVLDYYEITRDVAAETRPALKPDFFFAP